MSSRLAWVFKIAGDIVIRSVRPSVPLINRIKESKGAKIRNRYNQVPHLTQDTNEKVTNSQVYTTNKSKEGSPFPAGDHNAQPKFVE